MKEVKGLKGVKEVRAALGIFLAFVLGIGVFGCSKSDEGEKRGTEFSKKSIDERVFLRLDPGGHTAIIRDLFFFDHGKRLISASDDKTIRVWDVSDLMHPELIKTIRGEIGRGSFGKVYAIALDPAERIVAVGGALYKPDNPLYCAIRLHDLKTGKVLQVLKGHHDVINALAFSPDGKYLASGSLDNTVVIWKKEGNGYRLYRHLMGHGEDIYALSFSAERLATGSDDHTVRLYDVNKDFKLIKVLRDHEDGVRAVACYPDGRHLVTGSCDKRILLYDRDGNFIREFSKKETVPLALTFSPDGRFLLAGSRPDEPPLICYLYEFPSGRVKAAFKGHKNSVFAVAATRRDGRLILATGGGEAQEILLWDEAGRILSRMESVGTRIVSAAISSDGKRIGFGFTLREKKPNYAGPLEFSYDLKAMKLKKISSEKGLLRAREKRDGLELSWNPLLSQMMGLYYPQSLLEVKKGGDVLTRILRDAPDGYRHECFGFVNDRLFISGGMNGKVFVYNLRGEKVAELVGHEGEVWAVAVTPDGKWAVTGGDDQTVRIWYLGNLKDVSWGDEGVDWERLKEASPRNWKRLYPQRKALASLRSSDPVQWRALVNSIKDAYMPIRKIYPTLTLFPSKDGKEWVTWTPEGYFTGSSPSALRFIGYHINHGFYKQAGWVSFSQLYDIYFRPDLIKYELENPTVDLSKKSRLPTVNDYLSRQMKH